MAISSYADFPAKNVTHYLQLVIPFHRKEENKYYPLLSNIPFNYHRLPQISKTGFAGLLVVLVVFFFSFQDFHNLYFINIVVFLLFWFSPSSGFAAVVLMLDRNSFKIYDITSCYNVTDKVKGMSQKMVKGKKVIERDIFSFLLDQT